MVLRDLSENACSQLLPCKGDQVFSYENEQDADKAFTVVTGYLLYSNATEAHVKQLATNSRVCQNSPVEIEEGLRLCEAALWAYWRYQGKLEAITACDLVVADCSK